MQPLATKNNDGRNCTYIRKQVKVSVPTGFVSGTRPDLFQVNDHLNQILRGSIAKPRALEVVSNFQPLKLIASEHYLTPPTHFL